MSDWECSRTDDCDCCAKWSGENRRLRARLELADKIVSDVVREHDWCTSSDCDHLEKVRAYQAARKEG